MVVKNAWALADEALAALPRPLREDDLTVQRFYNRNRNKFKSMDTARRLLKDLVDIGQL